MARPMVLIKQPLLVELFEKYAQGVPVLALIRQYRIDGKITAPTLTKLLGYMSNLEQAGNNLNANEQLYDLIHASLFPSWLNETTKPIMSSPSSYIYVGKMPIGKWLKKEDYNG